MNRRGGGSATRGLGSLVLGIAFVLSSPLPGRAAGPSDDLARFLPKAGEVGAWKPDRAPQAYDAEDLYNYIDGGAEIYQEYGFKRVVVQDYKNDAKKSVQIEIFEMARPESAFGMYSFKTGAKGRAVPIGDAGSLEGYYLNFRKGTLLVTLTAQNASPESQQALETLARAVARKLPAGAGRVPPLATRLPKGFVPGSVKYLLGPVGLYNSYQFFTSHVFGFAEAARADYPTDLRLFVFGYKTPAEASAKFGEVVKALKANPRKYTKVKATATDCEAADDRGKLIVAKPYRAYILVSVGGPNVAAARTRLQAAQQQLGR